jgi:hypothetical protein
MLDRPCYQTGQNRLKLVNWWSAGMDQTQMLPIKSMEGRYMTPTVLVSFVVKLVLQINYI